MTHCKPNYTLFNSHPKENLNEKQSSQESFTIRIVTCGQPLVGKTSLLKRLTNKTFNPNEPPTVGSEYIHFDYSVPDKHQSVQLQIWDTAGEEKYRSLAPIYFRNSNGALLVFDQTSRNTFDSLNDWIEMYKKTNGDDSLFFVIANKSDLIDEKQKDKINLVQNENFIYSNKENVCNDDSFLVEAFNWAKSQGYPFFETSAKTGEGIDNLLFAIVGSFIEKIETTKKNHFYCNNFFLKKYDKNEVKCSC